MAVSIRAEQVSALRVALGDGARSRVLEHLREHHRVASNRLTHDELERLVERGTAHARRHGLHQPREQAWFVAMMLCVSARFYEHPRIGGALGDPRVPAEHRIAYVLHMTSASDWEEARGR